MENKFKAMYVTGDIHGRLDRITNFIKRYDLNSEDYAIVVLGDMGIYWNNNGWDAQWIIRNYEADYKCHIFFIDGNHENFNLLNKVPIFNGIGAVSPHIHYLPRGFIFEPIVNNIKLRILCCGGADSVDKVWREEGKSWWPQEAISKTDVSEEVFTYCFDYVFTHCCGYDTFKKYKSILISHNGLKDTGDHNSEKVLQSILDKTKYSKHLFGHYHVNCKLNEKERCLYEDFIDILDEYPAI